MTLPEIEAFLAIIKTGTISKAAETLFISQSAMSRRLKSLESELGYPLFLRKPGIRNMELTKAGKNFIKLAERWILLWSDIQGLGAKRNYSVFRISSLDSIGTYILPSAYKNFIQNNRNILLDVQDLNSFPAYDRMEAGFLDLAFTMHQRFSEKIMTLPAFSESMQLISSRIYGMPQSIHPSYLVPDHEIHISWSMEYEKWHNCWFSEDAHPYITIEKMTHLEYFIQNTPSWAIVPSSVANALCDKSLACLTHLEESPPKRISNYLTIPGNKHELIDILLNYLRKYILDMNMPGVEVLF